MAFPTYREHGVAWTRGVDPLHVMGLFRGVDNGGWDPVERGFNLYTIVIGAQCLHATGYAMGVQRDGAESAVLAFLGDGATSQGDVNEAIIFAASFSAPVVFFCQNNQYAISEPLERQTRVPLLPARRRLRLPRRPGRRQRRPRRPRGDPGGAGRRPRGPGPDLHRGVHLPDGRAHHLRRPDPLPAGQRARGVEAARPDRPAQGLPGAQRHRRRRVLRRPSTPRATSSPRASGRARSRCPTRRADQHVRPRLRRADPAAGAQQRAEFVEYHASFEGGEH